jgi:UDP-N-acetylglucosamine 2-epimerase (non-hydrolysing)
VSVAVVVGTRPEAIKMAPVVRALSAHGHRPTVIATAQHREMLDQVLEVFQITADLDLDVMRPGQSPEEVLGRVLTALRPHFSQHQPGLVLVHGDTITTFAASLAAYLARVPVGHVEAGLRTFDKWRPFPEEMNRSLTGVLADLHFSPTEGARQNLLREGRPSDSIFVTGNTVIDAVRFAAGRVAEDPGLAQFPAQIDRSRRLVVVTCHRRESFGAPLQGILRALRGIVEDHPDIEIALPVHPNPNVEGPVREALGALPRVHLLAPQSYFPFVALMRHSHLLLTDSGGLQEEGPALQKPVLVMREVTERPEAVDSGCAALLGTDEHTIRSTVHKLLTDESAYRAMSNAKNPFGDGTAGEQIAATCLRYLAQPLP